jgi:peroxiredoxin
VKKLEGRPFALLGVNVSEESAAALKKAMEEEKLPWRSFADPPGEDAFGRVAAKWHLQRTPTLYVLDHKGVIRHKWIGSPGEEAIDRALHKLVEEAEADAKKPK